MPMVSKHNVTVANTVEMADIRILLVETDDLLLADVSGLGHPEIMTETLTGVGTIEPASLAGRCDVLVVNIDLPGGFALIEKVGRTRIGPPVIALAGQGVAGRTLEHRLILAELRGAAVALPKPIDAEELALASLRLLAKTRPPTHELAALADELEQRLAI